MLHTLLLLAMVPGDSPSPITASEIVEHMIQADDDRRSALAGYTVIRRYRFENRKYGKKAEMKVRMECDSEGAKTFEVIEESGSGFVRNRIIRKMIEAESEASQKGERKETRIVPENYDFRLVGQGISDGRRTYILEISPKTASKFSVRGRIWVDDQDFAIVRIEGQPAKNPSVWIRSVKVVQRYERSGKFWLPATIRSVAQARVFGETEVVIEYSNYVTNTREAQRRHQTANQVGTVKNYSAIEALEHTEPRRNPSAVATVSNE